MNEDRALLKAIIGYHEGKAGSLSILREAVSANTCAAPVLRELGNYILGFHGEPEIALEAQGDRATNDSAYMTLWDINQWVLTEDPETGFGEFMANVHPAMMNNSTMAASPEAAGLYITMMDKAAGRLWEAVEELAEVEISEENLESLDEALIAFARKYGTAAAE